MVGLLPRTHIIENVSMLWVSSGYNLTEINAYYPCKGSSCSQKYLRRHSNNHKDSADSPAPMLICRLEKFCFRRGKLIRSVNTKVKVDLP